MTRTLPDSTTRFDPTRPIETARTPPAWWYIHPDRDAAERRQVLAANWQVVAHQDELTSPGAYVSGCLGGEPWVVIRQENGSLDAFSNVCRHNGTQVAVGRGITDKLTCPYHGWTYQLDGTLATAPRLGGVKEFRREDYALPSLPVMELGPLVLVHLNGSGRPLPLDELTRRLDASGWEGLVRRERRTYELQCNWKVFVDNYLDGGYHVPFLHRDLAEELDLDGYRTELFDRYSIQTVAPAPDATKRLNRDALYAWVYPNLMINRYGPMMDINVVVPTGPTSCRVIFDWYFDSTCEDAFIQKALRSSEQVQNEDIAICESLQVGMGSIHFRPGPYAPKVEMGKLQFHRLVHADMA